MEQYKSFIPLAITILGLIAVAWFVDLGSVKIWVESAGVWGPLIFIILKITTIVNAPLSVAPLYPVVGILFGFWHGVLYVEIGDFLGYTIAFSISRFYGRKMVDKFISSKEESVLSSVIGHVGTPRGFLHACLTLFAMPELLAYGAGLTKLPFRNFILILMPLSIIASSILVFFGSLLNPSSSSLWIGLGIPLLGAAAILIGGTLFAKSVMKDKTE